MFKDIKIRPDINYKYTRYHIIDTDFSCFIEINGPTSGSMAIISEYQKRQLPVVNNICIFYNELKFNLIDLQWNQGWLDRNYPLLNYGRKYYTCVVRQYKQLRGL